MSVEFFGINKTALKKSIMAGNNSAKYLFNDNYNGALDSIENIDSVDFYFDENKNIERVQINLLSGCGYYLGSSFKSFQENNFNEILEICGFDNCIPAKHHYFYDDEIIPNSSKLVNWNQFNKIIFSIAKKYRNLGYLSIYEKEDGEQSKVILGRTLKGETALDIWLGFDQILNLVDVLRAEPDIEDSKFMTLVETVIWNKKLIEMPVNKRSFVKSGKIAIFSNGIVSFNNDLYAFNSKEFKEDNVHNEILKTKDSDLLKFYDYVKNSIYEKNLNM